MFTLGVIADIHGNLEAFDGILEHMIDNYTITKLVCLGDIVGYGPSPIECIERTFDVCTEIIKGNHDEAISKAFIPDHFNPIATETSKWHIQQLKPWHDYKKRLYSLSPIHSFTHKQKNFSLIHGGPSFPLDEYVYPDTQDFYELLPFMELTQLDYLLLGHTHKPYARVVEKRMILNPGSVGQPRDNDPRASYAVIDVDKMEAKIERVEYDIGVIEAKLLKQGLPSELAKRLYDGR
ncbi:MAG: metallophosphoesterase family protein [Candidatus Hodarchaeales archaeon]